MILRIHFRIAALLAVSCASLGCVELKEDQLLVLPSDGGFDARETGRPDADARSEDVSKLPDAAPDVSVDAADEVDASSEAETGGGTGADPDADADACVSECEAGAFRCGTGEASSVVQVCVAQNGCLTWHDAGACQPDHICCDGACARIDESRCFSCGVTCGGDTPACDKQKKACGCDARTCPVGKTCDAPSGTCVIAVAPSGYDIYVSATTDAGTGDGTRDNPFRTITAALAVARARASGTSSAGSAAVSPSAADAAPPVFKTRIYVGPGLYDDKLGEQFPLVIPGGVELRGAGPNSTTVTGLGYQAPPDGGMFSDAYWVTVLAGHKSLPTQISDLTLRSVGVPLNSNYGIYCDQGNVPASGTTSMPPNTLVRNVVVGPDYGTGIMGTVNAAYDSACNLGVYDSTITRNINGLTIHGCKPYDPKMVYVPAGVELIGNTFSYQTATDNFGTCLTIGSCVPFANVQSNSFLSSDEGIQLSQPLYLPERNANITRFDGNTIDTIERTGFYIAGGAAVVDSLVGNRFTNVTGIRSGFPGAMALNLAQNGAPFPLINRARNNVFVGNDFGVYISSSEYPSSWPISDFGTKGDPGNNVFSCNSTPTMFDNATGADVVVDVSELAQKLTFPFRGNVWDHKPPTENSMLYVDVTVRDIMHVPQVEIDAVGAQKTPDMCPPLRTP